MASAVTEWLLDSDPSIRWQVMRDVTGESTEVVARERARVATEGWGARLLDLQADDGHWGGGPYVVPGWIATTDTLVVLKDLGLDAASPRVRRAIERVRITNWGPEFKNSPYFDGEEEACINGRVLACGAYFGQPSASLVELLLSEQKEDGGWNCWPRTKRSSFHSTICVLEGLLEYERATRADATVRDARLRAHDYLLASRHVPAVIDRRNRQTRVDAVFVSRALVLRRAARTRLSAQCRCRSGRARCGSGRNSSRANVCTMAAGRSRIRTKAKCTSKWKEGPASRAAGTHCARCAYSTGIRNHERQLSLQSRFVRDRRHRSQRAVLPLHELPEVLRHRVRGVGSGADR